MGKTYTKKIENREARLSKLPTSERLRQSAMIKKKEGRVLDAAEKHALMMTTEYGEALKLWEVLRTVDVAGNLGLSDAQEKRAKKRERMANKPTKVGNKKTGSIVTKFGDSDNESSSSSDSASESDNEDETATQKKKGTSAKNPDGLRGADRYAHKYATIDRLMQIIEPKFDNFVRTPRISRVIQSMIKYGSSDHLDKLVTLLSKDFATYANDSFGHYVLIAMFKHAPHQLFRKLLASMISECPNMCKHAIGLRVIHTAYTSKLCSAADKQLMLLAVFKDGVSVMKNWKGYPDIEGILANEKDQQKRLVSYLYGLVDKLVCQKDAYTFPFVQRLTLTFMRFGNKDDVIDMCDSLRPHLQNLLASGGKDGALLASMTFALLEPKMRKEPLRQFSTAFLENACGKFSAPAIARLFDIVYDTQLLAKFVAEPLIANLPAVVNSPYGYGILVHLFTPSLARKDRLWTPAWNEYNLYSRENPNWNTHTWLDADFNEETVEICPRPAEQTHAAVLRPIVDALVKLAAEVKAAEDKKDDGKKKTASSKKVDSYRFGIIAREAVNLAERNATYSKVFEGVDLADLKATAVLDKAREEVEEGAPAEKMARVEKNTTTPSRKTSGAAPSAGKSPAVDLFSPVAAGTKAPPSTPSTVRKPTKPIADDSDRPMEVTARRRPNADSDDEDESTPTTKKVISKKLGGKKVVASSKPSAKKVMKK